MLQSPVGMLLYHTRAAAQVQPNSHRASATSAITSIIASVICTRVCKRMVQAATALCASVIAITRTSEHEATAKEGDFHRSIATWEAGVRRAAVRAH
jgi:hypothetical protein